jgi:hypothetical protein
VWLGLFAGGVDSMVAVVHEIMLKASSRSAPEVCIRVADGTCAAA